MLKKILFISICIIIHNCYILDSLDLSLPESVNGKEAKQMILTAALTGAAISAGIDGRVTSDSLLAFFSDKLAGINEAAFYDKIDVERCAADAQFINLVTFKIGGFLCNMPEKEHKFLIDWPIKLF